MLSRVGSRLPKLTNRTIKRRETMHIKKQDHAHRRFAAVEELGALTVFLASEAAASITGIALPVDGGWTAH
jgi:3-hydroxybutyrate dehydrogenase